MSRSSVPSLRQINILLDILEEKKFLATGHARTSHARDQTRAACEAVANRLNSEGSGAIKSGPQWAKYWKDKKSSTKKKASQMRMARLRTGGGSESVPISKEDEKILKIMGGEAFAVGDRALEIDVFQPSTNITAPFVISTNIYAPEQEGNGSESILQGYPLSLFVEPGTECANVISVPVENQPPPEQLIEPGSPPAIAANTQPMQGSTPTITPPRRERRVPRRRLLQRTPPSQRRSQMASLTERFLAIEERRLETMSELSNSVVDLMRLMTRQTDAVVDLNKSVSRQTEAVVELCKLTKEQFTKNK